MMILPIFSVLLLAVSGLPTLYDDPQANRQPDPLLFPPGNYGAIPAPAKTSKNVPFEGNRKRFLAGLITAATLIAGIDIIDSQRKVAGPNVVDGAAGISSSVRVATTYKTNLREIFRSDQQGRYLTS
jgi:hypothetical protein